MLLIRLVKPIFESSEVEIYLLDALIKHVFLSDWRYYDPYVGWGGGVASGHAY